MTESRCFGQSGRSPPGVASRSEQASSYHLRSAFIGPSSNRAIRRVTVLLECEEDPMSLLMMGLMLYGGASLLAGGFTYALCRVSAQAESSAAFF